MEAGTLRGTATVEGGTGSRTIADLLPRAAALYGDAPAVLFKTPAGEWLNRSFAEVGETVAKLALGLIALGIEKGDKVSILANTRPEWTYVDFAALSVGAIVVPIYQTNSAEECQYVLENSDAKLVIVENAEQLAKIEAIREQLPKLEQVVLMEGEADDVITLEELRARGAGAHDPGMGGALRVDPPGGHLHLHLHLRDHRAAEGLRDQPRQLPRDARHDVDRLGRRGERDRLPLSAARPLLALLLQLGAFEVGGTIAYWERDPLRSSPT